MKHLFILIFLSSFFINIVFAIENKKVLYINSYDSSYLWSANIEKSIKKTLRKSSIPITFRKVEMDTKRNNTESYKKQKALQIKKLIEDFNPDLIITSDDNAAKYIIVPYFYNSKIPFIFCGINASAKKYGFPSKNVTGMVEVQLIKPLIKSLKQHSKGKRIGYLKVDDFSSKIEANFFEKQLNSKIDKRFVTNIKEWKENFLDLQKKVDMLLIGTGTGVKNWKEKREEIKNFVIKNSKIPSGSWDHVVDDLVLLTYANIPQEQGEWAAKKAIEVLKGKDISSIPITKNKKATIHINTSLGKKLNIVFPFDLIDNATLVK